MIERDPTRNRHWGARKFAALATASASLLSACGVEGLDVVRSDIQPAGMDFTVQYNIDGSPNGGSEENVTRTFGPFTQLLETTFTDGSGVKTQESTVIDDGNQRQAYSMVKPSQSVGITNYLEIEPARYLMRNQDGSEACGIKVRQQFTRDAAQAILLGSERVDFDALWYYTVPCPDEGDTDRTNAEEDAELYALIINEQWTPRVTGEPLFINRGHSVTIVGDSPASQLEPRWWEFIDTPDRDDVKDAAEVVRDAILELDQDTNRWLKFGEGSAFADADVIYSAGDADVYDVRRLALGRQGDYFVNYKTQNEDGTYNDFKTVIVRPIYNFEWNDWDDQYEGYLGQLKELLNDEGQPKEPSSETLKEIERSGCQNCPNPTLEQLQFINPDSGEIQYSFTLRAFKGADDTLFMMGPVEPPSLAAAQRESEVDESVVSQQCRTEIAAQRADDTIEDEDIMTQAECAAIIREGKLWDYLVSDADEYGFDLVGHYNVRDESTWAPIPCSGDSGGVCGYRPIAREFDATYKFSNANVEEPLAVLNLLGEVGVRTLGISYASGKNQGSGLLYAMEQIALQGAYFNSGEINPETPFLLDSRADQLPSTITRADHVLNSAP